MGVVTTKWADGRLFVREIGARRGRARPPLPRPFFLPGAAVAPYQEARSSDRGAATGLA